MRRFRRRAVLWAVYFIGDYRSFHALIQLEMIMALETLQTLVSQAQADFGRLVAKANADQTALAAADQQIADFEGQAAAIVQPLADQISQAAPAAPAAAPQDDASAAAA